MASSSSSSFKRWLGPEVYPLFAAVGVAVGICGLQLVRNISGNPEVSKITKSSERIPENLGCGHTYILPIPRGAQLY
ncbi:NADH-ubiquinone reductase complex 1 MLRQ subunit [Tanacetum coccineum]|uniref:NADH-ubiquinone reductase complex 1 MLRQ subunit n=1 Tax=Tanacetum coccineum TaxID=301880 RepID=A0ABQ4YUL0_9ASTR